MFGFLNVNKPVSMTSFAVVARLRKIFGIKKIGHAGTLDPFAQGVLPIAIGKATRLLDFLSDEKAYIATIQFGWDTDTYDLEGEITQKYDTKIFCQNLAEILPSLGGKIAQTPPKFSAIKINGKKLCDLARKGQAVGKIMPRNVYIKAIKLLNFDFDKQQAKISVECSKGTYIRSLAYDIGQKLNCGAHLTELIRTNSSGFLLENACNLEDENLVEKVENPLKYLDLPILELDKNELEKVIHGCKIKTIFKNAPNLILMYNEEIAGVGVCENSIITVKKVFYDEKD